jgi:hypothetical protein
LSFAVPKSSNQCSGLSMQCSTRCDPSGNATMAFFTAAVSVPVTTVLPAKKPAKEFGFAVCPTTPALPVEKPKTPMSAFDVPITPGRSPDVPTTPAVVGMFMGTGGPCVLEMPVTPLSAPEMLWTPGPKNDAARTAVPLKDKPCAPSPSRAKPMTPGWCSPRRGRRRGDRPGPAANPPPGHRHPPG